MWLCIVFSGHLLPKGCGCLGPNLCPTDYSTNTMAWQTWHSPPTSSLWPTVLVQLTGEFLLLQTQTSAVGQTALGCQQNYWQQISGHQRIYRKSIICQHSTCVFRVVKRCAQTDNCLSMHYKGGTVLKVWFGIKKQRFPSTNPIAIQDSHWLVWHARQHELIWTRNL